LPLKEVDLKTFEAYKKAIRLDLPKITAGNTKFWIYRDVELPNAAGKKQKIASFIALVDEKAIKPLLKGKTLICKGTCGLEDGKVSFDAEQGKVPYKLLKASVPLFLGKMVHIPANVNEDAEVEDGEGAEGEAEDQDLGAESKAETPTETVSPTPEVAATPAALAATWNKLLKDIQAAVAAHPDRKEALTRAASGVPDLIKANKAAEAQQRMEVVQGMLNAPPPPAPPPPPPTQAGGGLAATWNKLVKDLQAAAAAHPERKEALSKAAAGIPDLIKANKTDEAKQKMDALQAMLDAPPQSDSGGATPTGGELSARWNALVKRMQAAVAAHPEKKADIVRAGAGIPDMIRVGKLDLAKKLMDGVEAVLGDTAPKQNPREKEYRDRYAELEASLAQALKDPARDASRLRAISAFAIEKSDAGDFDAALKALKQLEEVLGVAPTQEPPPEVDAETEPEEVEEQEPEKGEVDPEQAEFGRRFAELDSRLREALLARIGNVSAMRSVSGFASEKAEAGEYETALKALDRLERLLDSAGEGGESESGIPYEGLVKYRSALFQFAKAKDKVARQIAALKSAIPAILPEEVETANEVADELAEWNEDLSEAIDQAMNTAEDDDSPVTDAIRAELKKYLDELSSDKLIEQVDQSKFGVPMSIAKTLGDALRNIQQSMPTHA
jgi:hypothetical protein